MAGDSDKSVIGYVTEAYLVTCGEQKKGPEETPPGPSLINTGIRTQITPAAPLLSVLPYLLFPAAAQLYPSLASL